MNLAHGCPNLIKSIITSSSKWFVLRHQDSRLFSLGWHVHTDDVTVAKSVVQNSIGFASCIYIAWSMNKWLGTRLSELLIKPIVTLSSKRLLNVPARSKLNMCSLDWYVQADDLTIAKSWLQKQRRFCIVPSIAWSIKTWLGTRLSELHQVHHDFIIEMLTYIKTQICFITLARPNWQRDNCKIRVAKNSAGFAVCTSIAWSVKKWLGTRLSEPLIKPIMTSSSKRSFSS